MPIVGRCDGVPPPKKKTKTTTKSQKYKCNKVNLQMEYWIDDKQSSVERYKRHMYRAVAKVETHTAIQVQHFFQRSKKRRTQARLSLYSRCVVTKVSTFFQNKILVVACNYSRSKVNISIFIGARLSLMYYLKRVNSPIEC
jgi:hypothetical protein